MRKPEPGTLATPRSWSLTDTDSQLAAVLRQYEEMRVVPAKAAYVARRCRELVAQRKKVVIWTIFLGNVDLLARLLHDLRPLCITGMVPAYEAEDDEAGEQTRERRIALFKEDPDLAGAYRERGRLRRIDLAPPRVPERASTWSGASTPLTSSSPSTGSTGRVCPRERPPGSRYRTSRAPLSGCSTVAFGSARRISTDCLTTRCRSSGSTTTPNEGSSTWPTWRASTSCSTEVLAEIRTDRS